MDEERSDKCMHDRQYMEHIVRPNKYECMDEERSDKCMHDRQYEEHSDDTIIKDQPKAKANHKKYAAVAIKRTQKVAIIKRGP
jgi:hypothetical protein